MAGCLVILVVLSGLLFTRVAEAEDRELPLVLPPMRLAESLNEPIRTAHITAAQSLHEQQQSLLAEAGQEPDQDWRGFLMGLTLALDEYYLLELSYPASIQYARDSGCLLAEWEELGFVVCDYVKLDPAASEMSLVYIPQPLGLNEIGSMPGAG